MKTRLFRVWALGVTISSLAFCTGCEETIAKGDMPLMTAPPATLVGSEEGNPLLNSEQPPVSIAPNGVEAPAAPVVQAAVPLTNVVVSSALEQVVKMIQSGVGEDVILSYVSNSPSAFGVGSDQIIYLHDLGASSTVIKSLIQHDSAAETQARQQAANAAKTAPAAATPYPGGAPATATATTTTLPPSYEETQPVTTAAPAATTPTQVPVSVNYFYNYLNPYGNWVEVEGYGLCWQPTVAVANPDWRPYCDQGHWLWTDNGWYWYSDYSWGWAPFHYGRWWHQARVGWVWAPDTSWGPAWVSWRESGDYCGWAPLPPECAFVPGAGLRYRGAAFSVGFDFGLSEFDYTFVPTRRFCERQPFHYFVPRPRLGTIFAQSIAFNQHHFDRNNGIINPGIGFNRINAAMPGRVPKAVIRSSPLAPPSGPRPEHLEIRAGAIVVNRPVLPRDPPPLPRIVSAPISGTAPNAAPPPGRPSLGQSPSSRPGGPRGGRDAVITTQLPSPPALSAPGSPRSPAPAVAPQAPTVAPSPRGPQNPYAPSSDENRLSTRLNRQSPVQAPSSRAATAPTPPSAGSGISRPVGEPVQSPGPRSAVSPPAGSLGSALSAGAAPTASPARPGASSSSRGTVVLPPISSPRTDSRPGPSPGSLGAALSGSGPSAPSSRSFSSPSSAPSYSAPAPSRPSAPPPSAPSYSAPAPSRPSAPPPSAPSYSAPARSPSYSPPAPSYSPPPASRPPSGPPPSSSGGRSGPGGKKDDR